MLPENVNWNAVLQSITDTWLPLIGMVAAIILVAIIVHVIQIPYPVKTVPAKPCVARLFLPLLRNMRVKK